MNNYKHFEGSNPSTLNPKPSTFQWPQSPQSDLFAYLKPEQQEFVKPILRILKKPAQIELCCTLLDYMEGIPVEPMNDMVLDVLFAYLTRTGILADSDDPANKCVIRPLCPEGSKVSKLQSFKVAGNVLNKLFPFFKD